MRRRKAEGGVSIQKVEERVHSIGPPQRRMTMGYGTPPEGDAVEQNLREGGMLPKEVDLYISSRMPPSSCP